MQLELAALERERGPASLLFVEQPTIDPRQQCGELAIVRCADDEDTAGVGRRKAAIVQVIPPGEGRSMLLFWTHFTAMTLAAATSAFQTPVAAVSRA